HFRKIVEFPQAATDGLSDEQYIRNVVDTIFRPAGGNK
ncbi:MAG: RDD family protein, partial [Planctomycetaceae bacterium]